MGLLIRTAFAVGWVRIAASTSAKAMPKEIPNWLLVWGLIYMGMAPQRIRALMTLRWTLRGRIISSPGLQTESTIACTDEVVPLTIKKAWWAPKASAANSSASLITLTGWQRLSKGFIELTSTAKHCSPRKAVSAGLPLPPLWPGTSKGTTRLLLNCCKAS